MSSNIGAFSSDININKKPIDLIDQSLPTRPFKKNKLTDSEKEQLPLELGYPGFSHEVVKNIFSRLSIVDQLRLSQVNSHLNNQYWSLIYPKNIRSFLSNPYKCKIENRCGFINNLNILEKVNYSHYVSLIEETEKVKISISNDRYRSLLLLKNFNKIQELDYSQQLDEEEYIFDSFDPDSIQNREFLELQPGVTAPERLPEGLSLSFPDQITKLTLQMNHLNNRDILPLAPLKNLTYLDVSYNILSRLGVMRISKQFPELNYLDIGFQAGYYDELNIQGSDIPFLNSLKYLETLKIGHVNIDEDSSMDALGGLSPTLKSIYMFNKVFTDILAFKEFQLEHLEIGDIEWDDELRKISVLKDSLKSLTLTQIYYVGGDLSDIFTELIDFSKLEKINLSSYYGDGTIKNADNFWHLIKSPIKTIQLDYVYTSALNALSCFSNLMEVRLDNCKIDETVNLKAIAEKESIKLRLHLHQPSVENLKFVDTLKLKKLAFSGIEDEENLNDETLFNESAKTLEGLTFKLIKNISSYSKILRGLNLSKLKVQAEKDDYALVKTKVHELTSRMSKLKDLNI